jgi:hypothetical protein
VTPEEREAIRKQSAYSPLDSQINQVEYQLKEYCRALLAEVDRLTAAFDQAMTADFYSGQEYERARIREAIKSLPFGGDSKGEYALGWEDAKAHVLAIIYKSKHE